MLEITYKLSIHFLYCLTYNMVTGSLLTFPVNSGQKAGDTLDRVPTHRRAHSHTPIQTLQTIWKCQVAYMSLGWEKKPEHPEETPKHRENAYKNHTGTGQEHQLMFISNIEWEFFLINSVTLSLMLVPEMICIALQPHDCLNNSMNEQGYNLVLLKWLECVYSL